jgi:hypothetical protein
MLVGTSRIPPPAVSTRIDFLRHHHSLLTRLPRQPNPTCERQLTGDAFTAANFRYWPPADGSTPFQPIASVSIEEDRFSSPAYLRSCVLLDYEPRDVNAQISATTRRINIRKRRRFSGSLLAQCVTLRSSTGSGLLSKTLSRVPDRLRSIMKSSLLRLGTCNSMAPGDTP